MRVITGTATGDGAARRDRAASDPPKPPSRPRLAFALLAAVQFTLILAIGLVTLPLPAIQGELGMSRGDLALFSAAYGLSFSGLLLLGGRLADLFGRRRTFTLGVAVFGLASAAVALAPGLATLLVARFAQGAGAALAAPAAMALLGTVFPEPGRRDRAIAAWGGLNSAGATLGTVLGGLVAAWVSWRWAFAIPVVVAAVAVPTVPRLLPPGPPPARTRLDVPGALLVTVGLSTLSYGLVATLDRPWPSTTVLVPLVAGAVLLAAFAAVESRSRAPLVPPSFLASARRATALLTVTLSAAGIATSAFFLSLYFQQVRGWSPLATSAAFLPYFLVLATSLVAGRLVVRAGTRAVTVTGLAAAAAGLLLLSRMGVDTPYAGALLAGLLVLPIGLGLTFSGAMVAAVDGAPDRQAGLAGGVANTAMEIGPTVGLALLVSLAGIHTAALAATGVDPSRAMTGGYAFALGVAALVFAATGVLAAVALRPRRTARRWPANPPTSARTSGAADHHPFTIRQENRHEQERVTMTARFTGKVALVTGGGSGIGRATALAFAREGATVVVAGRNPEPLTQTVKLAEAEGGRADAVTADVTRAEDAARLVETAVTRYGGLHIAFNNAGVLGTLAPVAELDEATWTGVLAANLTGVWLSMKNEIAHMRVHGGGTIVNTASSIGAHMRLPGMGAYAAAKAGVSALTRTAARECIGDGIRINAVSPGPIDTPMSMRPGETEADRAERVRNGLPIGRVGALDEVAAAVLWLASPASGFAVGHDLVVDGGATA